MRNPDLSSPEQAQQPDLGREGGHSARRVLHAGDITGREVSDVLLARCRENKNITILEHSLAVDLISSRHLDWHEENICLGAYVMDTATEEIRTFLSSYTLLATGGAGKSNAHAIQTLLRRRHRWLLEPALKSQHGVLIHPTILFHPKAKSFLISEAVRGEGAVLKVLRNGQYVEFMQDYHPLKSLAPRDIVARAIDNELKRSGQECAWLDIRHHPESFLKKRFPNIFQECLKFGVNMATDLIPVVPAAHYCCGGVRTDVNGVTNVKRLYAIGEVGCTGLHGANRLASNSLLEAMVVGYNAVHHSAGRGLDKPAVDEDLIPDGSMATLSTR